MLPEIKQDQDKSDMEPVSGKFVVEKFDGKGDFGLWKHKILCQLELMGLDSILTDGEVSTSDSTKAEDEEDESTDKGNDKESKPDPKAAEKNRRVRSLLTMSLGDKILRKVMKEKTALDMWKALERSYQTKSLPNRIYMKQRFYSFKMEESKSLDENMDVFLKLVSDLASVQVNISEEDQAIFLLNSLPKAYEQMAHSLKYGKGKDTITVE